MKNFTSIMLLLMVLTTMGNAKTPFLIKPKGYTEPSNSSFSGNQMSSINKVGGYFRLKELSSDQKMVETDMVTYFISKADESSIYIHLNCAKPIFLNYELTDSKHKHTIKIFEKAEYYRLEKTIDLSRFKDGVCSLSVYNEKYELVHVIEFEKSTIK